MTELDRYIEAAKQRTYSKPGRRKSHNTPPPGWMATPNGVRLKTEMDRVRGRNRAYARRKEKK